MLLSRLPWFRAVRAQSEGRSGERPVRRTPEGGPEDPERELMAVYKRGGTWWYEFIFAGKRVRESGKTSRKTIAIEAEKQRRRDLERSYAGLRAEDPAKRVQTASDALKAYVDSYEVTHRPKSVAWVKERKAHLDRLLCKAILPDLTESRIIQYMSARRNEGAGNRTINMELDCLARAFGRTWREMWPKVAKLDEPCDIGRALSAEEEGRILGAAAQNKSPLIYPFIRIGLLTGMRYSEIRNLQLKQLDLHKQELRVGHAKTPAGEGRSIPMNAELFETISGQVAWLKEKFGEPQLDWYLFPFSNRVRPVDPMRPVTTIKTAWESVRNTANVDCRFHDLRHTAATKMAENDTPEATMKALLGHMSRAMLERYSHIRDEAKRRAVQGLKLATPIIEVPTKSPTVTGRRRLRVVGK
jgi:integrase